VKDRSKTWVTLLSALGMERRRVEFSRRNTTMEVRRDSRQLSSCGADSSFFGWVVVESVVDEVVMLLLDVP